MRYVCWFTAGFTGAILLSLYLPGGIFLACACLLVLTAGVFLGKGRGRKVFLLLLAGAFAGFLVFEAHSAFRIRPLLELDGKTLSAEISLTEKPSARDHGWSCRGFLTLKGRKYGVKAYFSSREALIPGDRVKGEFTFRMAEKGRSPGLLAFGKGEIERLPAGKTPWWAWPGKVRAYSENVLGLCLPEGASPFAKALFLGDTRKLPFSVRWDLSASGIRHLVAVSGLHVSVLCLLLGVLTFRHQKLTALLGFPVLLFFGAVTGFSPSVQRAVIMMSLLLLGRLLGKRYDPLTELSLAVLLMLLMDPMTAASLSFQLSGASVLGILTCYRTVKRELNLYFPKYGPVGEAMKEWFCSSMALSLSSLVFVTPILALSIGRISLIAPLTNLLTIWIVTPIFWGILLLILLSTVSLSAAAFLGRLLAVPIYYVLGISHLLGRFPLAEVVSENFFIMAFILFSYFMGFYLLRRSGKEFIYFWRFTAAGLLIALVLSWGLPAIPRVTMTVFDVGQGQCILLRSRGKAFLVDCGGEREEATAEMVLKHLHSQGIFHLDGMILTHFDRDHVCAAEEVLSCMDVSAVYLPPDSDLPEDERIHPVSGEVNCSAGKTDIRIFPSESGENSNDSGLCVLLDSPEYDILITGDRSEEGERMLLKNHRISKVDCLIAGHHGAKNATSEALLKASRPDTVIISAGKGNPYGHPAPAALLRIKKFGASILRTDLQGTITIRR